MWKIIDGWIQKKVNAGAFTLMRTFGVTREFLAFFISVILLGITLIDVYVLNGHFGPIVPAIILLVLTFLTMKENKSPGTGGILEFFSSIPQLNWLKIALICMVVWTLMGVFYFIRLDSPKSTEKGLEALNLFFMFIFCYISGVPPQAPKKQKESKMASFHTSLGF